MNRDQFFEKLAPLTEEQLKKVLWTVYWRGPATVRERVEGELDPARKERGSRPPKELPDPELLLVEVRDFVSLARSGAYLAGDRRVSPRQRTRWRFRFRELVGDAQAALQDEDPADALTALEELVDLTCAMRAYDYFRSEDPVEAAGVVVSDVVALLWARMREVYGFAGFAARASSQLIRWESPYGWTRFGAGRVREKETSLAEVLARMLQVPDAWTGFADHYLAALDEAAGQRRSASAHRDRITDLAEWHRMLLEKLSDDEADGRLDRLTELVGARGA